MQLRQRTAAWVCLIPVPAILPLYFLFSGGDRYILMTVISCASYLLAFGLYIGDHDSSTASRIQGVLLTVIGTLLALITWVTLSFEGVDPLFGQ